MEKVAVTPKKEQFPSRKIAPLSKYFLPPADRKTNKNCQMLKHGDDHHPIANRWMWQRPIGCGSFGEVYLAVDLQDGTEVAVKMVRMVVCV